MPTIDDLNYFKAMPLNVKIRMTKTRIREWVNRYGKEGVYISFSGGKDSTVLLDIVRSMYPDIPAVFVDVPTQYPELKEFATSFDNVTVIKPKISFLQVCEKYGFPLIGKEVSECVQGARKYLTNLLNEQASLTDRQTDRQAYKYFYEKISGYGKYAKSNKGGYDCKYRKLRGIGEFTKLQNGKQEKGKQPEISNNVGDADKGQEKPDKGEYP